MIGAVQASYDAGITDEFIEPIVHAGTPRIEPGDSVIFFNFRPDRGRQLSRLLLDGGFDLTTMTRYSDELDCPVVFGEQHVPETLAEVLSGAGARRRGRGRSGCWRRRRATCRATTSSPRCRPRR